MILRPASRLERHARHAMEKPPAAMIQLLPAPADVEQAAADIDLSQRIPVGELAEHLDPNGRHYLRPALVHTLSHRPDVSRQWRCEVLLAMADGSTAPSLLDVLPQTFISNGSPAPEGETNLQAETRIVAVNQGPARSTAEPALGNAPPRGK